MHGSDHMVRVLVVEPGRCFSMCETVRAPLRLADMEQDELGRGVDRLDNG